MEYADAASPPPAPAAAQSKGAGAAAKAITPDGSSLAARMQVHKSVVDELLLVCGVIGTTVDDSSTDGGGGGLVPVTDCLNWLQDLQRALRRDDDLYRPISLLLGQWRVAPQKLLPLALACRYDTPLVLTVCKILVILTKPLAENTVRAAQMAIDTKKTKHSPPEFDLIVAQKIKLRENAIAQCNALLDLKHAICHHPSHQASHGDPSGHRRGSNDGGLLSVFVSLLAEPLSRAGSARTDADHLTIELVLHLFRNLLAAEALPGCGAGAAQRARQLHCDLVALLEQEMVLEILLVLAADLEARENQPYNLMVMELVHHLLRHHDPTAVARAGSRERQPAMAGTGRATAAPEAPGRLAQQLQRERQALRTDHGLTRHSHFGGAFVVEALGGGRRQVVPVARMAEKRAVLPAAVTRRANRRTEPFVPGPAAPEDGGPAHQRALRTLDTFCERFVRDCYGPFTKSVKNEFRRETARLEDGDHAVFFRIVWFFCQWWRVSGKHKLMPTETGGDNHAAAQSALGQLIFTMDIYTFNLVFTAMDSFLERKNYPSLAQSVAVYGELMHLLHVMSHSVEETERIMAMGLMNRLFYNSEPIERLPKLLNRWMPGTTTREYLCDLVEVAHLSLKLLEEGAKQDQEVSMSKDDKLDKVEKMKAQAADFDVGVYFARKIVSNQTVFMYTQLLSCYETNAPHVNHRIVAFFLRLGKFKVASPEASPDESSFLLRHKVTSLEPMLYNIQVLVVLDRILNDISIRKQKDYSFLLSFAMTIINNFAQAAKENPVWFVEALFKHPHPHRFCEFAANMYVDDELRQIAERDLYMEEGKALEREELEVRQRAEYDSDSSEELEFEDFGITGGTTPTQTKKRTRRVRKKKSKRFLNSDSEDSEDEAASPTKGDDSPKSSRRTDSVADSRGLSDETSHDIATSPAKKLKRILDEVDEEESGMDSESLASNDQAEARPTKSPSPTRFSHDRESDDDQTSGRETRMAEKHAGDSDSENSGDEAVSPAKIEEASESSPTRDHIADSEVVLNEKSLQEDNENEIEDDSASSNLNARAEGTPTKSLSPCRLLQDGDDESDDDPMGEPQQRSAKQPSHLNTTVDTLDSTEESDFDDERSAIQSPIDGEEP